MEIQQDIFEPTIAQQFDAWRQTPGGKHVLKYAYIITARLLRNRPVDRRLSIKLVWELMRDQYQWICARLKRRGIKPQSIAGYALNNDFTAYVARHIMAHRSDWSGRFELRELNRAQPKIRTTIIKEEITAKAQRGKGAVKDLIKLSDIRMRAREMVEA